MALDVFDDDDGVVDDESGGEGDAEEGERVDGEAEDLDEGEGADERDGNGDGGDDGGAPVLQEEEDDDDDDDDGLADGRDDLVDGVADDGGGVDGDDVLHARGEGLFEFVEDGAATLVDVEGVGVGELLNTDADGVSAGEFEGRCCRSSAPISARPTSLSRTMPLAVVLFLRMMFSNCAGIGQAADDANGHLEVLLGVGGLLTELAGGDFDVLLGKGVGDVEGGEAAGGEAVGIEPDAHGVLALAEDDDGADAGDALEGVADVDVEVVGDEGLVRASGRAR